MDKEKNEGKITKEEFADKVIRVLTTEGMLNCPSSLGRNGLPCHKDSGNLCSDCWKYAIEQGVEK